MSDSPIIPKNEPESYGQKYRKFQKSLIRTKKAKEPIKELEEVVEEEKKEKKKLNKVNKPVKGPNKYQNIYVIHDIISNGPFQNVVIRHATQSENAAKNFCASFPGLTYHCTKLFKK
jgi:hypothetical protein